MRYFCTACSFADQLVYSFLSAGPVDFLVSSECEAYKSFLPACSLSFPPLQLGFYRVQVFRFDEVKCSKDFCPVCSFKFRGFVFYS